MRGWSVLNGGPSQDNVKRSVAVFEDALRIDPDNGQVSVGLPQALTLIHRNRWDPEPARILARADEAVTRAISLSPNYAHTHYVKAEILGLSRRFEAALATYDRAIALDPNHAAAYVGRGRNLIAIGRARIPSRRWRRRSDSARVIPTCSSGTTSCATRTPTWRVTCRRSNGA